jgi:hypothetical protein
MQFTRRSTVRTLRRSLLAVVASVAVHVALVAAAVGVSAWRMFSMAPPIRVQTIAIDLVKELPLGAPASREPPKASEPPLPVRKTRQRVAAAKDGVTVVVSKDAGAPDTKPDKAPGPKREPVDGGSIDGGRRRPGDLRSNGPEGSRVIALLHLDRLRASPDAEKTTAALDQLLTLLPDRRRLIDGTGLELYRDFDSLLIATPNPVDPSVTFLAARHHLGDVAMKAGLERGAKAAQKAIRWQTVDGRPVGIRQQPKMATTVSSFERDDRILVLPETNMAIIATPAYAAQLLGVDPANPTVRANLYIDGGVSDGKPEAPKGPPRVHWQDIVERIDAEDTAVPEDAAFMMSATNVFGATPSTLLAPGTRGTVDDTPPKVVQAGSPAPEVLTLVVGAQTPYVQVIAEFKTEADAERWEQDLPAWRRQLLVNPLVLVSGFSPLIRRAEVSRDGANLELRIDLTVEEIQRLLNVVSNLTRTAFTAGRR